MAQTTFALDISRWVNKVKGREDIVVRKVSLDLLRRIVLKTPVGNPTLWKHPAPPGYVGGRARMNWFVTVGRPSDDISDQVDPSGGRSLQSGTITINGVRAGAVIYIVNNLPYIIRLEEGWSRQAPVGMVKTTVEEYLGVVAKATAAAKRDLA